MDANTARQLAPRQEPKVETHVQPTPVSAKVPVSKFEILLCLVASLVLGWMVVNLISAKITLNAKQEQLQAVQTKVSSVNSSNTSIQQEIAELTSQSHLKKVAQKYGLTDANSSVRNVNN